MKMNRREFLDRLKAENPEKVREIKRYIIGEKFAQYLFFLARKRGVAV